MFIGIYVLHKYIFFFFKHRYIFYVITGFFKQHRYMYYTNTEVFEKQRYIYYVNTGFFKKHRYMYYIKTHMYMYHINTGFFKTHRHMYYILLDDLINIDLCIVLYIHGYSISIGIFITVVTNIKRNDCRLIHSIITIWKKGGRHKLFRFNLVTNVYI